MRFKFPKTSAQCQRHTDKDAIATVGKQAISFDLILQSGQ